MFFDPSGDPQAFLAAIVESSDDAIIGKTLDGTIVTWNRAAERLYGYAASEIRGRSIAVLIPDDRQHELEDILRHVRTGERVEFHETVRRTKDGRSVDVWLTVSPVVDREGRVAGASVIARDISLQKRAQFLLQQSEARWRAIIESAVDGIVVIDAFGLIEGFNPAAERLFGYREDELLGQNVSQLMPSPFREEHDSYVARYLATNEPRIIGKGREVLALRRDGTTFPVHLAVGELRLGGERKFTGIIHDLTTRVAMEAQLREQAAMVRLGEMAAVIAHEVKNPLAGIRGAIQVIGSRLPAGSRDAAVTSEIVSRIDGLNTLMKDMLLFARPPRPQAQPVNLADLVKSTAGLLSGDPEVSAIHLEIDGEGVTAHADPDLLRIVLVNLLVNAAHAMEGHGTIRVTMTESNGKRQIVLLDSGPGIPEDIRQRIFTPFFTTKARGTGLGLPTAKRLIEAQNGTIDIDCPATGGTRVTIELPA